GDTKAFSQCVCFQILSSNFPSISGALALVAIECIVALRIFLLREACLRSLPSLISLFTLYPSRLLFLYLLRACLRVFTRPEGICPFHQFIPSLYTQTYLSEYLSAW